MKLAWLVIAVLAVGATARAQNDAASDTTPKAEGGLRRLERHKDWVWGVALSPDEWRLMTCSGGPDHTARVWDFVTGKEIRRRDFIGGTYDALWLPDGRRAVVAGADGVITLWDVRDDAVLAKLQGHAKGVRCLDLSRDARLLASGSEDGTARIWDLARGAETLKLDVAIAPDGSEPVYTVAFGPDGRQLLTGDGDGAIRLWDLAAGREDAKIEGHDEAVWSVAFLPDGRRVVSGSDDKTVRLWDLASGRERLRYEGAGDGVNHVAISRDGRRLAAGTDGPTIPIWELATGRLLHTIEVKTGGTLDLAFTADGSRLVGGCGDGTVWVASLPDHFPGEAPRPRVAPKAQRKGR